MKRKRYTYQDVKKIVEDAGYELLSLEEEIINNKGFVLTSTKVKVKCPNKNHGAYYVEFNNFKGYKSQKPTRCKQCLADELRTPYDNIKNYIENFNYKLLSEEYKGVHECLNIKCPNNHEFKMTYGNFQQGQRCPKCSRKIASDKQKHTYEYIKEYIESFGYKLLSTTYETARKPLLIQCDKKHEPYFARFCNFKTGYRCPCCNSSKGEEKIINWLNNYNIEFIYDEPYFNDLLSPKGNPLRPDFIIENKKIWIEYDGEFHYNKYYENDGYEQLLINDKIKNEYAKKNGWKLLRIPYWDFDKIEEILELNLR